MTHRLVVEPMTFDAYGALGLLIFIAVCGVFAWLERRQ